MPHLIYYTPTVSSAPNIPLEVLQRKRMPWTNLFTISTAQIRIRLDCRVWACVQEIPMLQKKNIGVEFDFLLFSTPFRVSRKSIDIKPKFECVCIRLKLIAAWANTQTFPTQTSWNRATNRLLLFLSPIDVSISSSSAPELIVHTLNMLEYGWL